MRAGYLLLPCALAALACARGAPADHRPARNETSAADSLRGTVQVVGSEPGTWVALMLGGGRRAVTLEGERPLLDRLAGLEVVVWGAPGRPGRFRVERFAVRAASGVAVEDGVLAREGAGWVLVTHDGRRLAIARLPQALQGKAGARVWLAGPLDRAPDSFGVVAEAP